MQIGIFLFIVKKSLPLYSHLKMGLKTALKVPGHEKLKAYPNPTHSHKLHDFKASGKS